MKRDALEIKELVGNLLDKSAEDSGVLKNYIKDVWLN